MASWTLSEVRLADVEQIVQTYFRGRSFVCVHTCEYLVGGLGNILTGLLLVKCDKVTIEVAVPRATIIVSEGLEIV